MELTFKGTAASLVLEASQAKNANAEVLEQHRIPSWASEDVRAGVEAPEATAT